MKWWCSASMKWLIYDFFLKGRLSQRYKSEFLATAHGERDGKYVIPVILNQENGIVLYYPATSPHVI